jgi:pimeloyl-ACP methyl ester carboxylesterase
MLAFLGTLFLAAYYDQLGMTLGQIWLVVLLVPIALGGLTATVLALLQPEQRFDPRESLDSVPQQAKAAGAIPDSPVSPDAPVAAPPEPIVEPVASTPAPNRPIEPVSPVTASAVRLPTTAARKDRSRDSVISVLHEMGELAPLIRQLEDDEDLLDVLSYVDSLRATLADSNDTLQGVVRAELAETDGQRASPLPAADGSG